MDTQRDPIILVRKRRRRAAFGVAAAAIAVATTVAVSRLEPALPAVDGSALWIRADVPPPPVADPFSHNGTTGSGSQRVGYAA
jgi:hypothetical protein